jgi:hypothetical protein
MHYTMNKYAFTLISTLSVLNFQIALEVVWETSNHLLKLTHAVIKTDSKTKATGHSVAITLHPWLYFYET